jgi:hypothetical protein
METEAVVEPAGRRPINQSQLTLLAHLNLLLSDVEVRQPEMLQMPA